MRKILRSFSLFGILFFYALSFNAYAVSTTATVSCLGTLCTITPTGGPVNVDPLGFTLDVDWSPQHIELFPNDSSPDWRLKLFFTFTGTHDTTENFGVIDLVDEFGNPTDPNVQFDDSNFDNTAKTLVANYEIFNPNPFDPTDPPFISHGLTLANSDGSGVTTLQWTKAEISPAEVGVWENPIPEPSTLLLFGSGLAVLGWWRYRKARA